MAKAEKKLEHIVDEYASSLDLKDDYNVEKHEVWLDAYQSEFFKQLRFQLHETQDKPLICMFQNSNLSQFCFCTIP